MLEVKDLHASVEGNKILNGINIKINAGEVHAIMGPNGSGKSTLSKIIAGHPAYEVTSGSINYNVNFKNKNLLEMEPHERAREGIFLAFQYPIEIAGISNEAFLRTAFNQVCKSQGVAELDEPEFKKFLKSKMELMEFDEKFLERSVNEGFSGGEKKRNEILQMAVLSPRLAMLDEIDSGLDIDALKVVAKGVNALRNQENAILMVTHYQRLLDYIVPDYVHVLYKGKIVESGDKALAKKLEAEGYDWIINRENSKSEGALH